LPPKKPANEPTTREATVVVVVPVLVDTGVVVIKVGLTVVGVLIGAVFVVKALAIVVAVVVGVRTFFTGVPEVLLDLLFVVVVLVDAVAPDEAAGTVVADAVADAAPDVAILVAVIVFVASAVTAGKDRLF